MTEEQFIAWLKGFLENTGNDGLNVSRVNAIKNKLSQVNNKKSTMVEGKKGTQLIFSC